MKKILTMLFLLAIVTGSVFAATTSLDSTITLKVSVSQKEPTFKFQACANHEFNAGVVDAGNELILGKSADLSKGVSAYFRVVQTTLSRYTGSYNVTYTATPFKATTIDDTAHEASVFGYGSVSTYATDVHGESFNLEGETGASGHTNTYKFIYDGSKGTVPADTALHVISVTWNANEDLPVLDYTATVSVKIESV